MPDQPPTVSPEMIALHDRFTHGGGTRRELVTAIARLAGGTAAALTLLPLIEARAEAAPLVDAADPRLACQSLRFTLPGGAPMAAYLSRPARNTKRLPKVMIIHENRGLNDHIRDVTRRLALARFVALAPDFLSPLGETPRSGDGTNTAEDIARAHVARLDPAQTVATAVDVLAWLEAFDEGREKPGRWGFAGAAGWSTTLPSRQGQGWATASSIMAPRRPILAAPRGSRPG